MTTKLTLLYTSLPSTRVLIEQILGDSAELIISDEPINAVEVVVTKKPSLIIVDLDSDPGNGISIVSSIREWTTIPVIFISRNTESLVKFQNTFFYSKGDNQKILKDRVTELLTQSSKEFKL